MGAVIEVLMGFLKPIVVVYTSIGVFISFLLGALMNPQSFMNSLICSAIDYVSGIFPSTPDNLKIGSIINSISQQMPVVGRGIVADIFNSVLVMIGLVVIVKIYKLLPFKMS